MRIYFILLILVLSIVRVNSQNDTIFSRDTIELNYQIKNTLFPDFQNILTLIASPDVNQNEIDKMIDNKVNGTKESKLFLNDKVIIDNDLNPGAANDKLLRGEMEVSQYLRNFNTNYTKTDIPNITLIVNKISALKKKDYFYYNVLFECSYDGSTTSGKKFDKFNRVAELVIVKETKWKPYIGAVRFPLADNKDFDSTNVYKEIVESNGDIERILKSFNDEKLAKKREEERKMKKLMLDGDDAFEDKKYDNALSKYREARLVNPSEKEPSEKIEKVRKAIAAQKQLELAIGQMKINAKKEKNIYSFKTAKVLCDSLIKVYNVTDADIIKLNDQMSKINSSLIGIEIDMESKNYSEASDKCDALIKDAKAKKDSISISEFNFQAAKVYYISNPDKESRIFDYVNQAVAFSDEHHQEALKLRANMFVKTSKISNAIQDATHVIQNDSYNPINYIFRGDIYKTNNFIDKAIDDYRQAIVYKTDDKLAFLNKAMLEYSQKKYSDVIKTSTDGIAKFKGFGLLYYYRGLAQKEVNEFVMAGKDFKEAIKYTIPDIEKKNIHTIATEFVVKGNAYYQNSLYPAAINEYFKAIAIDSSLDGLFNRAGTYVKVNKNDSALIDLNALLHFNPKYLNANCQRGIALTNLEKYTDATASFGNEIANYPTNAIAFYQKGKCELKQSKFLDASTSFDMSASILPTDSTYYYSSLAYYNQKNYDLAIAKSMFARKYDTKRFEVYYICGKAYYDKKNFNASIKEFETAKTLVAKNDDLFYCHALALEMYENYEKASAAYGLLVESSKYKDTALLRAGCCLIKTHDISKFPEAITKLSSYIKQAVKPDEAEAYAYIAYANLTSNNINTANENISAAQFNNDSNAMLQFALACRCALENKEIEALTFLEKALESKRFSKKEIENEKMLKPLRKNDKFKALLVKYY